MRPTLATAETAHSKWSPGPSPRCASLRVSSSSVALACQGAPPGGPSACRPGRWSASAPCAGRRRCGTRGWRRRRRRAMATDRLTLSPPTPGPAEATAGSGCTVGTTVSVSTAVNERVSSTSPNGSATAAAAGRSCSGRGRRSGSGSAHRVLPRPDPVQGEPRPAAQRVGQPVLEQQQPGRQQGDVLSAERTGPAAPRHPGGRDVAGAGQPEPGPRRPRRRPPAAARPGRSPPAAGRARRARTRTAPRRCRRREGSGPGWSGRTAPARTGSDPPARTGGAVGRARHRDRAQHRLDHAVGAAPGDLRLGGRAAAGGRARAGQRCTSSGST